MNCTILTVAIEHEADVVAVRQRAHRLAELLGFETQDQTRIATAASEIARNAQGHGGGGTAEFAISGGGDAQMLRIEISDCGDGIADIEKVLEGRHGNGFGIAAARRLIDEFRIVSAPGRGTTATLAKALPKRRGPIAPSRIDEIGKQLAREAVSDPVREVRDQNRELLRSLSQERARQEETARLNSELQDTNRGVVALYAELDQQAEQLRRASELKSRFLSNMSHEFRTPLNSVLALSRLLLDRVDGDLTPEQARQVEYIRKSAESLTELVNDLLDIAKVEAGQIELHPVEFSISDLFGGLRGALRPLRVSEAVELVFEEPTGLPRIYADEGKISQILRNFVSNALKFTERGEVRVQASLAEDGRVIFAVRDTGVGIEARHHATIFREFAQVDNPLQNRVKGTGLGLPLSKKLAELLGGEVHLESEPGVGSTFSLALPLGSRIAEQEEIQPLSAARQKQALVIDDDQTFRYVLKQMMSDCPYQITEAVDGIEGLERAQALSPDVIFLDLYMPRLDGYSVLQELARAPLASKPSVIVVTSSVLGPVERARLSPADAIVSKETLSRGTLLALLAKQESPASP